MEIRYFKVFNRRKGMERFIGIYGMSFVFKCVKIIIYGCFMVLKSNSKSAKQRFLCQNLWKLYKMYAEKIVEQKSRAFYTLRVYVINPMKLYNLLHRYLYNLQIFLRW